MQKILASIGIVILTIILGIAVYIFVVPFWATSGFYTDNISIEQIKFDISSAETQEEIGMALMTQYLNFYKKHGLYSRLLDYKIEKIIVTKTLDGIFEFKSTYSIKPLYGMHTGWGIGNGIEGQDKWVNNKFNYFYFRIENGIYTLTNIATGI